MKKRDVIIACDFDSESRTLEFLDQFTDEKPFVKIGMELFYSQGPGIVKTLKSRGHSVFLDLKIHDIPNTVRRAMAVLSELGADICNLHAGTIDAMQAALQDLDSDPAKRPLIIAVTQLTSVTETQLHRQLLIEHGIQDTVVHYAKNALSAGLSGVVCSPLEVRAVKEACGDSFITVTPGIRFEDNTSQDQARVTTPAIAKQLGCDYIVVGRPITAAASPVESYRRCLQDFI